MACEFSDPALLALRTRYLVHVAGRLEAFAACVAPYDRVWLVAEAHALAGSGGSFGFWDISARASELETLLRDTPDTSDDAIEGGLARLCEILASATKNT